MQHLLDNQVKYAGRTVDVHTDSQAALNALSGSVVYSRHVKETILKITEAQRTFRIKLQWIKGHADHTGNEVADYLAKEGNGKSVMGPEPVIPLPYNQVKKAINREFLSKWQKKWEELPGLEHSKLMMGEIDDKIGKVLVQRSREDLQLLAQIMTGHCLLGRHMSHWRDISCICRLCGEGQESPIHLLEECPALALEQWYHIEQLKKGNLREAMLLSFFREARINKLFYRDEVAEE